MLTALADLQPGSGFELGRESDSQKRRHERAYGGHREGKPSVEEPIDSRMQPISSPQLDLPSHSHPERMLLDGGDTGDTRSEDTKCIRELITIPIRNEPHAFLADGTNGSISDDRSGLFALNEDPLRPDVLLEDLLAKSNDFLISNKEQRLVTMVRTYGVGLAEYPGQLIVTSSPSTVILHWSSSSGENRVNVTIGPRYVSFAPGGYTPPLQ